MIEHKENLISDLLAQLLALGLYDDIFMATIEDVADIYTVPIPAHWKGIQLKIKRQIGYSHFLGAWTHKGYQTSGT